MIRYIKQYELTEQDKAAANMIAEREEISMLVAQLLVSRGIRTPQAVHCFLNPEEEGYYDPFLLKDMDRAIKRIHQAIDAEEHIVLFGDYDADGVCGTSMMVMALRHLGGEVDWYIPDRHKEGYGLNCQAVEKIAEMGTDLIITIDCGISNDQEIELAYDLGMEVIVLDHHQCPDHLPECEAVVNAHRLDDNYPFAGLCGAGTCLKVIQALAGEEYISEVIDLAAVATISDIVPMIDENRLIVREGLRKINSTPNEGIKQLMIVAGLDGKLLTSDHIAFQITPRINAGSRVDSSMKSVRLMTCNDAAVAITIAEELDHDNNVRKNLCDTIYEQAYERALNEIDFAQDRSVVLWGDKWNSGVIGIVANRLVEQFHMPVILLAKEKDSYVGSARSIKGVHLYELLRSAAEYLDRFGGHEMAAGMSLPEKNLILFRTKVNQMLLTFPEDVFISSVEYDIELTVDDIDRTLVQDLSCLQPTGHGNTLPKILLRSVTAAETRIMGKQRNHFKLHLQGNEDLLECVGFRMGLPGVDYDSLNLIVRPELSVFNGIERVQCLVDHLTANYGMKAVSTYLSRQTDEFNRGLFEQIYHGIEEECDIPVLTPEQGIGILRQRNKGKGAMVLCYEPHAAGRLIQKLEEHDCLQSYEVCTGNNRGVYPGINCIILCPNLDYIQAEGYDSIFIWGGLWDKKFKNALAKRLSRSKLSIIIENTYLAAIKNALQGFIVEDDILRQMYSVLRRAVNDGLTIPMPDGWMAVLTKATGKPLWYSKIALRVFEELGLLIFSDTEPYITLPNTTSKIRLSDSYTYQKIDWLKLH